jgi:hypothetical protein
MENPAATAGSTSELQVSLSISWEVFVLLLSIGVGLFSTFAGSLANASLPPRRAKAATAGGSARAVSAADLERPRTLVAEQERVTADLHAKLAELET